MQTKGNAVLFLSCLLLCLLLQNHLPGGKTGPKVHFDSADTGRNGVLVCAKRRRESRKKTSKRLMSPLVCLAVLWQTCGNKRFPMLDWPAWPVGRLHRGA
jgi:hypothetical protein